MNKPIWKEVAPEIECVTRHKRFPVDGGTCAACVADDSASVGMLLDNEPDGPATQRQSAPNLQPLEEHRWK